MRIKYPLVFVFVFSAVFLRAQTAGEMDALLETNAVSFAQAARFALVSASLLDEGSTPADAYALARERGWLPAKAEASGPIRLGELCFLVMSVFDIKGSFLYALFPGPRYAFRELDYLKLIHGRRDPAQRVSGERFLQILSGVTAYAGVGQPVSVEAAAEEPGQPEEPALTEREQLAGLIQLELEQHDIVDTTVRVEEEGIVISLNNIQFMPDSTDLTQSERNKLWEIADILSRYPDRKILVGGHSAMAGDEAGRQRISQERAEAVADFLISLGVRGREEVTVQGYGAQRPLGDNATTEGQAINRRVEIILLDE
jgi:outer membrane protein OmpA-like peptidoglycan-associated protein